MHLKEYNKKRKFNSTNEPFGKINSTNKNRFVVQFHQARAKHYDFRLEYNGVLLSWAVPKGLSQNPKDKRLAVMVEEHPVDYINFEGVIPKGNYGAGTVEIFDKGNYVELEDFSLGLKKGHLKFVLLGRKLLGGWSLYKIKDDNWLLQKLNDEYASTKLSDSKNLNKLPFNKCDVQLATLSNSLPKGKDWVYEIKYDGYRIIAYIQNGKVSLRTRNNIDYTSKFNSLASKLKSLNTCILDGEVVVFDNFGKTDFGLLQNSIKSKQNNFCYVIFDLLALNNEDLRGLKLLERKAKLERLLFKTDEHLIYSQHFFQGKQTFDFAKKNNLEGVIAKNINSQYLGKRTQDWLKIKCYLRQEFVVAGYTKTEKNNIISALLLGYYKDNSLIYVGKVGTGLSEVDKKELSSMFKNQTTKICPFSKNISIKNAIWLKPKFIAEIQYAELTKERLLRQPSFIGIRTDKKPAQITLEIVNETRNNKSK